MFICYTCGRKCRSLIYKKELPSLVCELCYVSHYNSPSYLHQSPHDPILAQAVREGKIHMTEAKDRVIQNQIIAEDGRTVIDQRTGKEADY